MKFTNQLSIIETLIQGDEVDTRIDCPFCNHSNTLTIKKENGKLLWYCFHASCSAKGKVTKEASMSELLSLLSRKKNSLEKKEFSIPKNFVTVFSTEKCTNYLKKNHCMKSYMAGRVDIRYDVLKKRFKKIIVALDRDATTKAFDISNQLRYYIDTKVKILEDDLKYYDVNQMESILK